MKLIIGNKAIKSKDGLYSLNDLHKASGSEKRNGPSYWLSLDSTKRFLETTDITVVKTEGRSGGTFAEKKAVYAYAMWISPEFQSHVIDAYDALVNGQLEEISRKNSRQAAKLEAPYLTDAIKHDKKGEAKHYHFSNEFNLINKVVLGVNAKQYRIEHGLEPSQPIRDTLTPCEIVAIEHMQRLDTGMIELGYSYEKRKSELSRVFLTRHNKALCAEVKRLES